MKRISQLNLDGRQLAIVIWSTAVVAGVLAILPNTGNDGPWERTLAALASVALAFVGYTEFSERGDRLSTHWQTIVWLGTFLLVVIFLARELLRQAF